MAKQLPARTANFIRRYINSLEQLEILLLLSSAPDRRLSVEEIYEEIRSNRDSIQRRLDQMTAQGLVEPSGREEQRVFRYKAATPELVEAIEELSVVYKEHRVTVIELIFAEPPSPIQGFADAFRIRKDENNG